jgi:Tfp pilus assembly protein PilO
MNLALDLRPLLRHLSRPAALAAAVALAAGVAALGASLWWRLAEQRRLEQSGPQATALQARFDAMSAQSAASAATAADFTARLPALVAIDAVVRDIQRHSSSTGVSFVSLDAAPAEATAASLGRTMLSITLRGEYGRIKAVTAEVLNRYPNVLLQRISMRQMTVPTDLEASITLLCLSRPAAARSGS